MSLFSLDARVHGPESSGAKPVYGEKKNQWAPVFHAGEIVTVVYGDHMDWSSCYYSQSPRINIELHIYDVAQSISNAKYILVSLYGLRLEEKRRRDDSPHDTSMLTRSILVHVPTRMHDHSKSHRSM